MISLHKAAYKNQNQQNRLRPKQTTLAPPLAHNMARSGFPNAPFAKDFGCAFFCKFISLNVFLELQTLEWQELQGSFPISQMGQISGPKAWLIDVVTQHIFTIQIT